MDAHSVADLDVRHVLWRDQDVLLAVGSVGSVDLSTRRGQIQHEWGHTEDATHHHPHTDAAIDSIHKDIELV